MNEPDRPRRDVSMEEAERMPMSEEELAGIEVKASRWQSYGAERDILALVAEVRRLRQQCAAQVQFEPYPKVEPMYGPMGEPMPYQHTKILCVTKMVNPKDGANPWMAVVAEGMHVVVGPSEQEVRWRMSDVVRS